MLLNIVGEGRQHTIVVDFFKTSMASMNTSSTIPTSTFQCYYERQIIATFLGISSVVGLFGNALVLVSIILSRKLRTITNAFVFNLSTADLLICLFTPLDIVSILSLDEYLLPGSLCVFKAFIVITFTGASVNSLVCIAINRWILVTKHKTTYRKVYKPRYIALTLVLIWFVPATIALMPIFTSISELGYSHQYGVCSLGNSGGFRLLVAFCFYPIQLVVTFSCYTKIYLHVQKSARAVEAFANTRKVVTDVSDNRLLSTHVQGSHQKVLEGVQQVTPKSVTRAQTTGATNNIELSTISTRNIHADSGCVVLNAMKSTSDGVENMSASPDATEKQNALTDLQSGSRTSSRFFVTDAQYKRNGLAMSNNNPSLLHSNSSEDVQTISPVERRKIKPRKIKITNNLFNVLCAFVLCLLPYILCLIFDMQEVRPYAGMIVHMNSCLNPIIYATKHPDFKKTFRAILCCKFSDIPLRIYILR